jgi:hypothetical protein
MARVLLETWDEQLNISNNPPTRLMQIPNWVLDFALGMAEVLAGMWVGRLTRSKCQRVKEMLMLNSAMGSA